MAPNDNHPDGESGAKEHDETATEVAPSREGDSSMSRVVVPVRYPLTSHSKRTLEAAVEIAEREDARLTVLHVSLFQSGRSVTHQDLREAVRRACGEIHDARYIVRQGFLVEETILEEIVNEDADMVVVGRRHAGRLRRTLRRIVGQPNVERFLRQELDCEVMTVD